MNDDRTDWAAKLSLYEDERFTRAKMDLRNHLNAEISGEDDGVTHYEERLRRCEEEANVRIWALLEIISNEMKESLGIEGPALQRAFLSRLIMKVGR